VHLTSKPSVHLPVIDSEHSQIHHGLDELGSAVAAGASQADVESLGIGVLEIVNRHFRHEERLMRASRYAEYTWHKRQHATALRKVANMQSACAAGDPSPAIAGIESVDMWFRDHISVADSMAGAHLRNYERENGKRVGPSSAKR
jgi:hemerythrin-like metal-binding protein